MTTWNEAIHPVLGITQKWTAIAIGTGVIKLVEKNCEACIVVDYNRSVVAALDTTEPTRKAIEEALDIELQVAQRYPDESLHIKLLRAEGRALQHLQKVELPVVDNPFEVFPLLGFAHTIIEAFYTNTEGLTKSRYIVCEDWGDSLEFKKAMDCLKDKDEATKLIGHNKVLQLIGFVPEQWLLVYYDGQWQEALTRPYTEDNGEFGAGLEADTGYLYPRCSVCGKRPPHMYYSNDRGDRMSTLKDIWDDHLETGCQGTLSV